MSTDKSSHANTAGSPAPQSPLVEARKPDSPPQPVRLRPRRRDALGRVGFTLAEAARALGTRPDAFRRLVERHARVEGEETIARLTGGVTARKRHGMGRWLVTIPAALRGE